MDLDTLASFGLPAPFRSGGARRRAGGKAAAPAAPPARRARQRTPRTPARVTSAARTRCGAASGTRAARARRGAAARAALCFSLAALLAVSLFARGVPLGRRGRRRRAGGGPRHGTWAGSRGKLLRPGRFGLRRRRGNGRDGHRAGVRRRIEHLRGREGGVHRPLRVAQGARPVRGRSGRRRGGQLPLQFRGRGFGQRERGVDQQRQCLPLRNACGGQGARHQHPGGTRIARLQQPGSQDPQHGVRHLPRPRRQAGLVRHQPVCALCRHSRPHRGACVRDERGRRREAGERGMALGNGQGGRARHRQLLRPLQESGRGRGRLVFGLRPGAGGRGSGVPGGVPAGGRPRHHGVVAGFVQRPCRVVLLEGKGLPLRHVHALRRFEHRGILPHPLRGGRGGRGACRSGVRAGHERDGVVRLRRAGEAGTVQLLRAGRHRRRPRGRRLRLLWGRRRAQWACARKCSI